MAAADYYLCDGCGNKTFYDANLDYDDYVDSKSTTNCNPTTGHPWPSGNVGYMLVLCRECAEKFTVKMEPPR